MRVLLGITGGIAAYKATGLIRGLRELGHEVTVLPTENALRFIGKPTLEALSGHAIDIDLFNDVASVRHVELGQQADLIIVAPATAAFLGRLAGGIADDLLMNAILASEAEVHVFPAMHTEMWHNPATRENVDTLERRGIKVVEPAVGRLTGSDSGPGRLPEVSEILETVFGTSPLAGKSVIVTAGGTRELIDEVRFIGNRSSGRMGVEIAKAARDLGAEVTLVSANLEAEPPKGIRNIAVSSVDELEQAMDQSADVIVMAAAVSDFQVAEPYAGKLKRSGEIALKLIATKDLIASYMSRHPNTFGVGFALVDEQQDLLAVSRQKLWDKGLSMVVGNRTSALGSDQTSTMLVSAASSEEIAGAKSDVAKQIVQSIAKQIA